jgi:adenylosuccinate synthase
VNGLHALAITKLDVLDGIEELQICTAYRCGNELLTEMPSDLAQLSSCQPVYEAMPGWVQSTQGVTKFEDLPEAARRYLARLEETSGVPAAIISTGSDREHTIIKDPGIW